MTENLRRKMRRVVLTGTRNFTITETVEPSRMPDEVLVAVSIVGVCGSDLHVFLGRHPRVRAPVVLGHECAGRVYWAPEDTGLEVGEPVTFTPLVPCKVCAHCRLNRPNICLNRQVIGFQRPGGLADIVSVPVENVIPLPEGFDLRKGALCEPLAVAVHAASLVGIARDQPVVVTGAGPIGLLVGMHAREAYGADVHFVEINPRRTEFAEDLGFEVVSAVSELEWALGSRHQAVVFECTGRLEVVSSLMDLVPAPAAVVLVGTFERSQDMGLYLMSRYETRVVGSQMYTMADIERAVSILSGSNGQIYGRLISSKVFPLEHVREAYEEALNPAYSVKVQVSVER
ncbi:zinc-dependent alcohol dehydrogenase [Rubrobacter calidifluminis]|uniref:zinc-dependent alcohol dehydrogenase n=1 Tax=Rubrobacter calidifluminis TaxID=1392640 RepID=UPI0023626281|nr:alcohol dehydrogenase catalytic domain-containing protein [Rubrobacter calidifluminis]